MSETQPLEQTQIVDSSEENTRAIVAGEVEQPIKVPGIEDSVMNLGARAVGQFVPPLLQTHTKPEWVINEQAHKK